MRNQVALYHPSLFEKIDALGGADWLVALQERLDYRFSAAYHGDFAGWYETLAQLPEVQATQVRLNTGAIEVGDPKQLSDQGRQSLYVACQRFRPWRKGPFNLFGIHIDTEWRSDWKWDRLAPHISDLSGRSVLDIGCGSGYHCWRMRGAGAELVIGIDPTLLFVMQYLLCQHFIRDEHVHVLPLALEDLPHGICGFDSVFSMGLLYHRRDPLQHLHELYRLLRAQGELVLETLVIEDNRQDVLEPEGRYAKMRNVWSIPSLGVLEKWLSQAGFSNIRCVDVSKTTTEEQRATDWMQFQSLKDFLDPNDPNKTVEGHPAPVRAIYIASR